MGNFDNWWIDPNFLTGRLQILSTKKGAIFFAQNWKVLWLFWGKLREVVWTECSFRTNFFFKALFFNIQHLHRFFIGTSRELDKVWTSSRRPCTSHWRPTWRLRELLVINDVLSLKPTNCSENRPFAPKKERIIFQSSILRGRVVSFRQG